MLSPLSYLKPKLNDLNLTLEPISKLKVYLSLISSKSKLLELERLYLNEGPAKTLQMVISDLMLYNPSKIKTSVIINRDQTMFPVKIDYSGLSLSTSVNEHVDVIIDKKGRLSVYLS
ncbi:hypothetical protein OAW53_03450 [Flavobacteriaceae bacterium]|nr:hypothetical protein [Flavobacteriaceae bacterium]